MQDGNNGRVFDPRTIGAEINFSPWLFEYELQPNPNLVLEAPARSVIATSTFYKPGSDGKWNPVVENRATMAHEMMKRADELGYMVICVDEGSDEGWRKEAERLGAKIVNPEFDRYFGSSNMGKCRRQAIDIACQQGRKVCIYLEPEKWPAVLGEDNKTMPLAMASTPIIENIVDWVIPRRDDNGQSYPPMQQFMERAGNAAAQNLMWAYAKIFGFPDKQARILAQYLDHFNGPKLFDTQAGNEQYFHRYGRMAQEDPELNDQWGSVHYPPFLAILEGKIVTGVPVPYRHPREQTEVEGRNLATDMKRYEQGGKLTKTLAYLLNKNLEKRGFAERERLKL